MLRQRRRGDHPVYRQPVLTCSGGAVLFLFWCAQKRYSEKHYVTTATFVARTFTAAAMH